MNKLLRTIVKELLLYWLIASFILLTFIFIYRLNFTLHIISVISCLVSKVIYERYVANYYSNYKKVVEYDNT
jgi:hypothetical protein